MVGDMDRTQLIKELNALCHEIATQDNLDTQDPVYCVQVQERQYVRYDPDLGNDVLVSLDGECVVTDWDELEPDDDMSNWRQMSYIESWRTVETFLTMAAAKAYIETQAHRHSGPLRLYGESAYRNTELKWLRAALPNLLKMVKP
jgi:hypothetical protein